MRLGGRLQAVAEIYEAAETLSAAPTIEAAKYLKKRRYIGSKDRRFIMQWLMRAARKRAELDAWLKHAALEQAWPMRMVLLAAISGEFSSKELHNALVEQHAPVGVGVEALEKMLKLTTDLPKLPDAVRANIPAWAWKRWQHYHANELVIEALSQPRPVYIRVNPHKLSVASCLAMLSSMGIKAQADSRVDGAIRVPQHDAALTQMDAYKQGAFYLQDIGSQIIMSSLPLKDGAVVFDYCAGAGGKSMALLTQQHHGLSLALCDVHESRLSEARDRITQLGRGAAVDYVNLTHNPVADVNADLVIVDAPCSGSGLWFRKPDRRYLYEEQDLAKFLDKQLEILIKSSSCVKVGGYLLYITCSLFEEENEGVMQAFTQHTSTMWERKAFVSEMMPHYTDNALANNPAAGVGNDAPLCMKLLPWEHDSDGFYACLLKRTA